MHVPTAHSKSEPRPASPPGHADELAFARAVLSAESRAVAGLAERLGPEFHAAVDLLERCAETGGTVLVTGLGKSGLIGAKISATMASLGIPSHSVHPSEAAHGDLGRFRPTDTVIALSFSGETDEVVNLASVLKQDGIPIIAICRGSEGATERRSDEAGEKRSSLQRLATVTLPICIDGEAGGFEFAAPTCSTTATLAIGDALALAVARRRKFSDEEFAKRHPGGALGGMLKPVVELMRFKAGKNCPLVSQDLTVGDALNKLETGGGGRRPGAIMLVDAENRLAGIFTDGDLRRLILKDPQVLTRSMSDVMTRNPRALRGSARIREAVQMVREFRLDEIPVVDEQGHPLGILDVQDLIAMRLVQD